MKERKMGREEGNEGGMDGEGGREQRIYLLFIGLAVRVIKGIYSRRQKH